MPTPPKNDPARILRFTTRGIMPDNRVQLWEGHNARALIPLDIRTIDARPMHAEETNLHLPSVRMASVFGSAQIVERTESFIAENPTGVIAIFFATTGEAFFYHRGGHISLKPGQALVYDADRPFLRGFNQGFRELVLTIPRKRYVELVAGRGPELPAVFDFTAGGGAGERALAQLVRHSLDSIAAGVPTHLSHTGTGREDPLAGVEEELLDLVGTALLGPQGTERGLLTAAHHHIEAHLHGSDLSPAGIAAAVGISERQLSRLFAASGTTVGRHLLERRLELARESLTSDLHRAVPVSEIGRRFGFASPSHFGRTFRERFGRTPLQWRKEHRA